jgi:hypothetical protein
VANISKRVADGFEFTVTEEMLDAVSVYIDYLDKLIADYSLNPETILVEQKLRIPYSDSDLFGTADLVVRVPFTRLVVVDYKHGAGTPVEAKDNKQLLYYALGALLSLPEEDQENYPIIEMVIVQPRTPGDAIDSWEIPLNDIWVFHAELLAAADRTNAPDAKLNAGPWCKWCEAKPSCPAIREKIQEEAGLDFVNLPAGTLLSPYDVPIIDDYTPEQISNILAHKSMIEDWLDALHKHAFSMAERGIEIPGFQLVEKWGHRKWENETKAGMIFADLIGEIAWVAPKLLSPAQMEKALKSVKVDVKVDNYTTKESLGKALAPLSDKRKPAAPKAIDDFKGFDPADVMDAKDLKIHELQRRLEKKAEAEPRWESGSVPDFTNWEGPTG